MKPLIGLLFFSWALFAQPVHLQFEPARTQVHYSVDSTLHTVRGTFALKSGAIDFDTATGEAGGEIVIDALSGDSGNGARDRKMHGTVLESDKFAEVKFVPSRVEGPMPSAQGESELKLHGQFLLHGDAHDMVIAARVREENGVLKVHSGFEVPYVEWGLRNPSVFLLKVAKAVEIEIEADAKMESN